MSTEVVQSDLAAICAAIAEGRAIDPELRKRAWQRAETLCEATRDELSVDLIREIREE